MGGVVVIEDDGVFKLPVGLNGEQLKIRVDQLKRGSVRATLPNGSQRVGHFPSAF